MDSFTLRELAEKERLPLVKLRDGIGKGIIVVLKHKDNQNACAIGTGCYTKVNMNLGVSMASPLELELRKLRVCEGLGTDTVMDLSTKDTVRTLKTMLEHAQVPVGTVPIYGCLDAGEEEFLKAIENHVKAGASFITVHAAITRKGAGLAIRRRITKIVSRGGAILAKYMEDNEKENPLYTNIEHIIGMMKGTGCAMSVGDALRPGCLADAMDKAMLLEMRVQAEIVDKCRAQKVPVFCEGPGHMPFDRIAECMRLQKRVQKGAPYYVLGPLVTDVALGYDHINAAIGATAAAIAGVDFLCGLTPSEHYALPTLEDVRQGIIAFKIAAHAADVVKKPQAMKRDNEMSRARFKLDWKTQEKLAITGFKLPCELGLKDSAPCSMCLSLCPMNIIGKMKKKN